MNKYFKTMAGVCICILLITGCAAAKLPEVVETTTFSVDKKGVVTSWLVDAFEKDYYKVSELTEMAVKDAADFNMEHRIEEGDALKVEKVELVAGGSSVLVQHTYSDTEIFEEYNECEFFYGTVREAKMEGYDLSVLLTDVKNRAPVAKEELLDKQDKRYVLITDAKGIIYCPRKITHVGDGVVYREDGSVDTTQVEGTVVVLMK